MPKNRSPIERERQRIRQRMTRLLARANLYGIRPWEFWAWHELTQLAMELHNGKQSGVYDKDMNLRQFVQQKAQTVMTPTGTTFLYHMLDKMGTIQGVRKPARVSYDTRLNRWLHPHMARKENEH